MAKQFCGFFCKTIYSFKKGNKNTQTNHYTLLTNASIKRCIKPGSEPCSSGGGGRVPARQVPYRQ